jgi:hypothetical protein
VPITTDEARTRILGDLASATESITLALACISQAFELLDDATAERLEGELFRPVQRALGRAKRTHDGFAERVGRPVGTFADPSAGLPSQGVKLLCERARGAVLDGDHVIAELQDSMAPIDAGDAELRTGLSEIRELLAPVPGATADFLRILGR